MRIFRCDECGQVVPFDVASCPACHAQLGYVTELRAIRVLRPTDDPAVHTIAGHGPPVWRCLNLAWGCNWTLPAGDDTMWCRSCRLTRGRPDDARQEAIEAWTVAEAAKRRLVHQLDELALPVELRSEDVPDGLAFDLVHLPGEGGLTGHLDGVVTLDLAEVDDRHRDDLRRWLGEPFRTVLGHLRHEIGHYCWGRLVGQSDQLERFRRVFGDERADYGTAVARYYAGGVEVWDPSRHITAYAASHPLEDWAETFAHYLHIVDATESAIAHGTVPDHRGGDLDAGALATLDVDQLLALWRPVNAAVTAIAESVGAGPVYPVEPNGAVITKLALVQEQIAARTRRRHFYGEP